MNLKYERKSDRVKSISFHPTRPLLLSALHSGAIELIDYRLKQRIAVYEDHRGAVRSVQFHPTLRLFCSGGDDFTVRVFNYKTCQFILKGHLDYVRCVNFHSTLPWVLSGSDDQTARVWNYQSRQTIAILTGHTHYIMACQFHPSQELIVTCSLDQTARLWSYGVLKQRYAQKKNQEYVLSGAEVQLVSIMDAHKDQINWCAFHPTQPFIITAADDRKIKIWKYTDAKAWEFDTLTGHNNNVCCAAFHEKEDVVISDSEDHTIRVWDFSKRKELACYENKLADRYWMVACHSDNYFFACGSDSSLQVFSLHRERVPMCLVSDRYLVVGEKKLVKVVDLGSKQQQTLKDLSGHTSANLLEDNIEAIEYNTYETQRTQLMVRCTGTHQAASNTKLHFLIVFSTQQSTSNIKPFAAKFSCFVGKTKVVRINGQGFLELYNYETDGVQAISEQQYTKVFPFPGGKVFAQRTTHLDLVDPLTKQVITSLEVQQVKSIVHHEGCFYLVTKNAIQAHSKQNYTKINEFRESIPIKSLVCLDDLVIYTTKSQLKYGLISGDSGVIQSTENILYLAKAENTANNQIQLTGMDVKQLQIITVDAQEIKFKLAVKNQDIDAIRKFIEINPHEAPLAHLYEKRLAHVALKLVKDSKARFSLSLDAGSLEQAYKIATEIKDPSLFELLHQESMRQGNPLLADVCDQQLNRYERLSFLYMLTGSSDKLQKLSRIHKNFQTNLFTGNLQERIEILREHQPKLADIVAVLHGIERVKLTEEQQESLDWIKQESVVLHPPAPVMRAKPEPWLLLEQPREVIEKSEENMEEPVDQWGFDDEELLNEGPQGSNGSSNPSSNIKGSPQKQPDNMIDRNALSGKSTVNSEVASVFFAAGDFEGGLQLLEQQINLKNREPLLKQLMGYHADQVITQVPYLHSVTSGVTAPRLAEIQALVKQGQKYTTDAKFADVVKCFQQVLYKILITPGSEETMKTLSIARNYLLAMRCDGLKQTNQLEMACKMSTIDLLPQHRILTLRQALNVTYKAKQYIACQQVARKLIKMLQDDPNSKPEVLQNAQKYERQAQQVNTDAVKIEFEEKWLYDPPTYSTDTLKFLDNKQVCPFDGAAYEKTYKGICILCGICEVGPTVGGGGWKCK